MSDAEKGRQVVPSKGPQHSREYQNVSSAKPKNVDSFGSNDARTRAFQACKQIEVVAHKMPDVMDDPKSRMMAVDELKALITIIEKTLPK
jgi:hypothetical protein